MWADKKGSGRVRAPGELILEYLFGKMSSKLISLPTLAAAVLAAARGDSVMLPLLPLTVCI